MEATSLLISGQVRNATAIRATAAATTASATRAPTALQRDRHCWPVRSGRNPTSLRFRALETTSAMFARTIVAMDFLRIHPGSLAAQLMRPGT
jgi:hypothetical protein